MNTHDNIFAELAKRAGNGDLAARNQLHSQLEHQMVHIVRLTLRNRSERTALDRQILAEARRLGMGDGGERQENFDELLSTLAHNVCAWVMERLHPLPHNRVQTADTVCQFADTVHVP